jgi:hypothetical protein
VRCLSSLCAAGSGLLFFGDLLSSKSTPPHEAAVTTFSPVGITRHVPTFGIPGAAQRETHMIAVKSMKPMKELAVVKPKGPV